MKIELRKNSDGSRYYSLVYYDRIAKKPVRISKADIRKRFGKDIIEASEASEICKILEAESDSLKNRIEKRVRWEEEFYKFGQLLEFYQTHQKKKAPNSYKNNVHYLKYYVLPYFLSIRKCNNLAMWYDFYPEFKDWLEDEACLVKRPEQRISYASKNHAVKALNTFMHTLFRRGIIDRFFLCESFPTHKMNEKGIDDLISPEEMERIYNQLILDGSEREALFFRFLYFTGLRFNEALGIHPANLYDGEIEDKMLAKHLIQEGISYYGYVVFDSQPAHETRGLRDKNGEIQRKPLKGKKKIDDKSARTVVITDKLLWNELVKQHNQTLEQFEKGYFGKEINQYPLFEGVDKSSSANKLKKAYEKCGLRYRSWHCCRHTRATRGYGSVIRRRKC
ncbi:MAG: hypothetical protein HYW48_02565 [Deltaproteobacteria bacterium]|nr:hypothetical protein [Deltaproteobacteria bacterium]